MLILDNYNSGAAAPYRSWVLLEKGTEGPQEAEAAEGPEVMEVDDPDLGDSGDARRAVTRAQWEHA